MDNKDKNNRPTENVECGVDSNEKSGNYVAGLKRNRLPWWPLLLLLLLLLLFLFKDQLASLFSHDSSPDIVEVDEKGHPIIRPEDQRLDDWIQDIIDNPIITEPNNRDQDDRDQKDRDQNPPVQNPLRNCDLVIVLEWNGHTDLDLSVIDPCGRQVYKNNGSTCGGGGKMDIDANCDESNLKNNPKEIIHYLQPQQGNYQIRVAATRWRNNGSNTLPLKVYCISRRHGTKVFNKSISPDQTIVTNWTE